MADEFVTGRVTALIRQGDSLAAELSVDPAASCARCSSGRGCGAGLFGASKAQELRLPVPQGLELRVGDELRLTTAGREIVTATFVTYGLPLAGLLAGGLLAELIAGSDAAGIVAAATGLVIGVLLARRQVASRCWRDRITSLVRVQAHSE